MCHHERSARQVHEARESPVRDQDVFSGVHPYTGDPGRDGLGPGEGQPARDVQGPAERDPGEVRTQPLRLRPRPAGRDDPDAGRREAAYGDPAPQGREGRADPAHADALRCQQAHEPRRERAPRPGPAGLRQRHRRNRRGGLHPGRPGRTRQARLGGRLCREPAPARAAEPDVPWTTRPTRTTPSNGW